MAPPDRLELALSSGALPLPETGPLLVIRAVPGPFLDALDPTRLVCEQGNRAVHDALIDAYGPAGAVVTPRAVEPVAAAVVNLTRARAESLGNVARALAVVPPGGLVAINGAKVAGMDSLARQVGRALPLAGTLVKAHGRVVWLTRPRDLPAEVAAWAAAAAPGITADGFRTAPGMFSAEGPDLGSRQLAPHLGGLAGRVADLGAGWGWLAHQALARNPAITGLDLFEAEAEALDAARANVTDPRAAFHWSDVTALGPHVPPYDAVIANPPFHQGRAAEPELGAAFIAAAARILKPAGCLLLVANRQLPYEAALEAQFRNHTRLSDQGGYKVLRTDRPRRTRR